MALSLSGCQGYSSPGGNGPNAPYITTQPVNQTVNAGQTATFTAAATGSPTPTAQWQGSTDGGGRFSNLSRAASATLNLKHAASQTPNKYRKVVTNTAGGAEDISGSSATIFWKTTVPPQGEFPED